MKLLHFYRMRHPSPLDEKTIDQDPVELFKKWFREAIEAKLNKPEAMAVATSTADGKPSVRMVLLKSVSSKGFTFFTNYESRKSLELNQNPYVSLLFHWTELERQVRIEGYARKTPDEVSDQYFDSRPEDSRISAIISPQSQIVSGRDYLEHLWNEKRDQLKGRKIPRPHYWGGYEVVPQKMEFWQTARKRLHDRILYTWNNDSWQINRLAP